MGEIYREIKPNSKEGENQKIELYIGDIVQRSDFEVKFRDNEIERIRNIMDKCNNKSVLLVGDYGCGKRSIIEGFVEKNPSFRVIHFDFTTIMNYVNSKKDYVEGLKEVFKYVQTDERWDNIIFVENLGHVINTNCFENGGYIFLNEFLKHIEYEGLRVISTATNDEYNELDKHFKKVLDYFTIIRPVELNKEQTCEILTDLIPYFEDEYKIIFPEGVCEMVCENADKYIKRFPFPKKGEDLLEEVCSYLYRNKRAGSRKAEELAMENSKLRNEMSVYAQKGDYHKFKELNNQSEVIEDKIKQLNRNKRKVKVTENDVLEAIGFIVNVPMTKLSKDKTEFLRNLPDEIRKDIIGQDETIDKIVKNIRRNRLGLRKKAHSAGNYMFIGSTGVGKTAFAKSLAKNLFGSEENIIRFDMSEFQSEVDVSKLLGSAPGYVGYKESGLLVKGLSKKPECVCLFDEIEKAHPKIYDVLLQLLDEGSITGSDGVKVDGSKALIIFTSNIGVKSAKELSNPMGFTENYEELKNKKEESIMRKALAKRFSPEFLNRLDSVCYFNNLGRDVLKKILQKEMKEMNINIRNIIHKDIVLNKDVEEWILNKVEEEHNGARPIIRLLEQEIEEEVANLVVNESKILGKKEDILEAVIENDKITLR